MKRKLTIGIVGIVALLFCACDSSPKIDRDKYDPLVYHKQACQELMKISDGLEMFRVQYPVDSCFKEYVAKEYSKSKADNLIFGLTLLRNNDYGIYLAHYPDDEFLQEAREVLELYTMDEALLTIHHYFRWYVNNLARLEHGLYASSKSKNLFPGKNDYKKDESYIDTEIKNRKEWERLFSRRMDIVFNKVKLPVSMSSDLVSGEGNGELWGIVREDQPINAIEVRYSRNNTKVEQLKRFDWEMADMKGMKIGTIWKMQREDIFK